MANSSYNKEYLESTSSYLSDIENARENDQYSAEPESEPESYRTSPGPLRLDPRVISDAILGLSDGMTVPFALTAGLSELGDNRVVVLAGLAELVAGAISMGLGGYLGAKSEKDIYDETMTNTQNEIASSSHAMRSLRVRGVLFNQFSNLPMALLRDLSDHIVGTTTTTTTTTTNTPFSSSAESDLSEFLVRFEHDMTQPADSRAITCALTIASGYLVGGFIPLLPYLLVSDRKRVDTALRASVLTMIITLFLLGWFKACLISSSSLSATTTMRSSMVMMNKSLITKGLKGGIQMLVVGGFSAGCAVLLVKAFNSLL